MLNHGRKVENGPRQANDTEPLVDATEVSRAAEELECNNVRCYSFAPILNSITSAAPR